MKKIITLVFTALFICLSYGQEKSIHTCATDVIHLKALKENISYKEKFNRNNQNWITYAKKGNAFNPLAGKTSPALVNTLKTLTVVFHDITNDVAPQPYLISGSGSYQYIVDKLNSIYSGANLGSKPNQNDTGIQFCLALQDTNGDSYLGIQTHYETDLTVLDGDSKSDIVDAVTTSGFQVRFPTTDYINIYIVDDIANGSIGNTAGFASLPSSHGNYTDGIFIERTFLINNGNLNNNMNVLAHEMGHYLGLFHVFGICDPDTIASFPQCSCDNANPFFNGDMVADTEPMELNFTCNTAVYSCGSSVADDKSNYMDYVNDPNCVDKFTFGQIDRMHFMLDIDFGPRNSLLDTNSCIDCSAMDGCSFNINSPQIGGNNEVSAGTPSITFNLSTSCTNSPTLNYSWQITNLDDGSSVASGFGNSFTTNISIVGNYQLTFTASLSTNANCFENTSIAFKVTPAPNGSGTEGTLFCNSLSNLNWTNANLERVQYKGGWSLASGTTNLTDYNYSSTVRYTDTDPNFEADSFDIISQGNFNDVNFPGVTIPTSLNNVIRVGKIINNTNNLPNGAAYYTKVTFKPTPDNCKFLIHYLGARQLSGTQQSASLGYLVQLSYESPFDIGNIKHIGQSEWGDLWEDSGNGVLSPFYNKYNTVLSAPTDFNSIPVNNYNGVDYVTTGQWNTELLDFSEFAILNDGTSQNFEVTLTFFARTNDQLNASQQAYGYFGIECAGGGFPDNFDFTVSDYDLPCQNNDPLIGCITTDPPPYPSYFTEEPTLDYSILFTNNIDYAFAEVTFESSYTNGTYFPYYPDPLNYFCHEDVLNNPFRYFRINYKTFTQSLSRTFRISNQFINSTPPCPNTPATEIAGTIIPSPTNEVYYFCPGFADFDLGQLLNDPCFLASTQPSNQYVFRWKLNGSIYPTLGNASAVNYTNLNLLLNEPDAFNCSAKLTREVQYIDPYCQNPTWYETEEIIFYIINIGQVPINLNITELSDFCLEDHLSFTIEDFMLHSCSLTPVPPLLPGITNEMVIQLTTSAGTPIGAPQTIALPFLNISTDLVFDIPNTSTNGNFLFPVGSNSVNLEVQMNLYGCSKTVIIRNIDFNVTPQAIAGSILLAVDCEEVVNLTSTDDGITNVDYTWEFSSDGGVIYQPIPFAPGDAILDNATSYFSTFPVLVRRRANAFPLCGGPAFTEAILLNDTSTPFLSFNLPANLCNGVVPPTLPEISNYGIQGSWDESVIDTSVPGVYTYTFTASSENCLDPFEYVVTILADCELFLSWDGEIGCQQSNEIGEEPAIEDVDITSSDCIRVCENSLFTFTLTGSTTLITSTEWLITGGTLSNETSTSCDITWDAGVAAYALQAIIHLTDGSVKIVNKCIEKVNAPIAQIGILPNLEQEYYIACAKNPINFENLSSVNGGNENLYYQWYFGDETFSTEFEPSHTYTSAGEYEVLLTVSNGCSCVSTHQITVLVVEDSIEITCPAVACEGQLSTYSISEELLQSNCAVQWSVIGGHISGQDTDVSTIQVVWDDIDQDGFGYVFVQSNECVECVSSVKIPVVKNEGIILGEIDVCPLSQNLYSLPQWPTTEFNWTLNNNGSGSTLGVSNQRNEIFINAEQPGTLELSCQYYNTLLQCGGHATLLINVKSFLIVNGPVSSCQNSTENYDILLENGLSPINLNYTVNGPNNFSSSGTSTSFNITFPYPGIYTFTVTAANYCMETPFEVKVESLPEAPTVLAGNAVICPGNIEQYSCPAPEGASTYWSVEGGSILGSSVGNQILVSFDASASTYSVSASYVYENCATLPFEMVLSTPQLNTTITSDETTVCGSSMGTYTVDETDSDIYVWTIDPASAGSINSGQNENQITVLWNQQPQTAEVKLAMRKCGQDFNGALTVEIQDAPTATIALASSPACAGSDTTFTLDLSPNIAYSYSTWDFGDNTGLIVFNAGDPIIHTYNDPLLDNTNYDVTVTVNGVSSCQFHVTDFLQIVVSPSPIIDVVPNRNYDLQWEIIPEVDMNYTVVLQNGYSSTDVIQWFHDGVAIPSPLGNQATLNAAELGIYYATVTNEHGCTATTQMYITHDSTGTGSGTDPSPDPNCLTAPPITTTVTSTGCQEITIAITNPGVPGTDFEWGSISGSNASIISTTNSTFQANMILPGTYFVPVFATYPLPSGFCNRRHLVEVTVPYIADLKYTIICNDATDDYTIELLDFSQFFVDTPIQTFEFTVNGGATWMLGTPNAAGINSAIFQLQPGTTPAIGIRISRANFAPCVAFKNLTIPNLPDADFVVPTSVCLDTAMQFIAPTNDPNVTYTWDFNGEAINLQPHPVKTFTAASNNYQITLTVSNQFGCVDSRTKSVQVFGEKFENGSLIVVPTNACEGEFLTVTYDPGFLGTLPESYDWYKDSLTTTPYASTFNQDNQITVTEPGQYFVYVKDGNGCITYTTPPTSAIFIPTPAQAVLTGTETICIGGTSSVKAPTNPSVTYLWSLNGILQPQWNGLTAVGMIHNQLGTYTYEVIAQIQSALGDFCSSTAAQFEVEVIAQPDVPIIDFSFNSCSPYRVNVLVSNPQAGIVYTWSNGATGTSTEMIHDGPVSVTAKSPSCQVSAQLDLPLDLYMHTWYYPTGCYSFCDVLEQKEPHYIIGPLVAFEQWEWLQNHTYVYSSGSGEVAPLDFLDTSTYQLSLQTPYCTTTLSDISIEKKVCEICQFDVQISGVTPLLLNSECLYQLDVYIGNPYGTDLQVTLGSVGFDGYFVQSTFTVANGGGLYPVLFFPLNGFTGGVSTLSITGLIDTEQCYSELEFEVPPLCVGAGRNSAAIGETPLIKEIELLVAPNPTAGTTMIYYNFGTTTSTMQIELLDMYGRTLHVLKTDKVSGTVALDCSSFEAGQYFVVLKQDGQLLKNSKLLIK